MESTVTVVGSLNFDLVTYTDIVPKGGETHQAISFEKHIGGKGLNEAIAISSLVKEDANTKVRMVGKVGDDSFGKELKDALVNANVDTKYVDTIEGKSSGIAVIIVEKDSGENRILITAGTNGDLKPTSQEYETYFAEKSDKKTHYVVFQNEYPDTLETLNWVRANRPGINIAYNPSPFKPEIINKELMSKLDLLIVNEGESLSVASQMLPRNEYNDFGKAVESDEVQGFTSLAEKLQKLLNQGHISTQIITMGSKGAVYCSRDNGTKFVPAEKVENVVDTTGAGDTFFGGVILQLAAGADINMAVKFATKASAFAIQKTGAAESIPKYSQVVN